MNSLRLPERDAAGNIGGTMSGEMRRRLGLSCFFLLAAFVTACNTDKSPTAPTTTVVAQLPPIVVPLPTTVPGVLTIGMPIELSDLATTAYGLAPFGYHGADHAEDGHPGWDVEYRLGGTVRAAAAGTVQNVFPDPSTAGRTTVQIEHLVGTHHFRTVYTNLATINSDVIAGTTVRIGQSLGVAGTFSQTIGTTPITFAMIHFQLDDFEYYRETPNPNAVSPEPFLSPDAKLFFDRIWSAAVFSHELVEPFATNPRVLAFPAARTWMRVSGAGPAGIRFTRSSARNPDYDYAILSESGTAIEIGTVRLGLTTRPFPSIDLTSAAGIRVGTYDIVSDEMRLSLASPGAARPADLGAASVYRTSRQ
jgi:hypothetical protein